MNGWADVDFFWIWEQHASGMMQVRRIHTGILDHRCVGITCRERCERQCLQRNHYPPRCQTPHLEKEDGEIPNRSAVPVGEAAKPGLRFKENHCSHATG